MPLPSMVLTISIVFGLHYVDAAHKARHSWNKFCYTPYC